MKGHRSCHPEGLTLNRSFAEAMSVVLLVVVLACAAARPCGWPEAVVAVAAAALVIGTGAISPAHAAAEAARIGPVIGFLAAVLALAQQCNDEGLFHACGAWMARTAAGRPRRLLVQVFAIASVITAVLSLDATVVLLTHVVIATDLDADAQEPPGETVPEIPLFALVTVACTLAGLVLTSAVEITPARAALAGAPTLAARALARRRTTPGAIVPAAALPFGRSRYLPSKFSSALIFAASMRSSPPGVTRR